MAEEEEEMDLKSAEIVASIENLLSKILLLLPIKNLLRFKSVSKDWWALISDPIFCHLFNPNPNPAAGIFLPPDGDLNSFEYVPFSAHNSKKFQFNFSGRISQSCNGLLLVESNTSYRVYNPTTDCCSEIPEPDGGGCGVSKHMSLVFDPVKSRHYEVVCVWLLERVDDSSSCRFTIDIYSSETRSWRVCGEHFAASIDFENGVYWNGAVHWLSVGGEAGLYFKIDTQVLEKMPITPFQYMSYTRDYYLDHSCDHLHLIEKPPSMIRFDVYEMRRDYSEWFVKYRVNLEQVIVANGEMVFGYMNPTGRYRLAFSVLSLIRGEVEEDSFLVVQTPGKIIRYNLLSETFDNLYEFQGGGVKGSLKYPSGSGAEYIESLCCV